MLTGIKQRIVWKAFAISIVIEIDRPDHGPLGLVGLGDDRIVWHIDHTMILESGLVGTLTRTLKGIVSERDFLRRSEIGTGRRRPAWLKFFAGPGRAAVDFVHERGRHVEDVMTTDPITVDEQTPLDELVHIMEKNDVKRLPVMSGKALVGIVTRTDILRAVADLAKEFADPTADDEHIRDRIIREIEKTDWRPAGFWVTVRKGVVHLHGTIFDDNVGRATIVLEEHRWR